jgi:hypothetical protein
MISAHASEGIIDLEIEIATCRLKGLRRDVLGGASFLLRGNVPPVHGNY